MMMAQLTGWNWLSPKTPGTAHACNGNNKKDSSLGLGEKDKVRRIWPLL